MTPTPDPTAAREQIEVVMDRWRCHTTSHTPQMDKDAIRIADHACEVLPDLLAACEAARDMHDRLSLGSLEAAAKYGDQYEPPTDEDLLKVRGDLEAAIVKAKGTK